MLPRVRLTAEVASNTEMKVTGLAYEAPPVYETLMLGRVFRARSVVLILGRICVHHWYQRSP